jgi:hypothetical protein
LRVTLSGSVTSRPFPQWAQAVTGWELIAPLFAPPQWSQFQSAPERASAIRSGSVRYGLCPGR